MISLSQIRIIDIREKINLLLNYLIIAYAFILPFEHTITKEFVKVMVVLWILSFDYKNIFNIFINSRVFQLTLAFSFFLLLSYLWSDNFPNTIYGDFNIFYKSFTSYFLFPLIIISTSLKAKYLKYLLYSFIFAMIINSLISFGIYFGYWDTLRGTVRNPIPFQISHISYSVFLALASLISIYKIKEANNIYIRFLWIFIFVIVFIDLFLTKGRTGQFSFILTCIILSIIYYKKHIYKLIFSFFLGAIILFTLYSSIDIFNLRVKQFINETENIINQGNFDTSFGVRTMNFTTLPYLVNKDNILFGVGLGNRENYVKTTLNQKKYPHNIRAFKKYGRLHNMYLEILISNGILGLFLFLSILITIFITKYKDDFFKYLSYSISILFFFVALTGDILFFYELSLLFSLSIALMIIKKSSEENLSLEKNESV